METQPLVSVLMTSYNREKYIAEAIESVLASSYKNFELIIVDDCSKDRTVEIAHAYEGKDSRVKVYVNESNLGDYPNRNKAASYAKGKYLKYVDSDDMVYTNTLATMVALMEKYPQAGLGLTSRSEKISTFLNTIDAYRLHFFTRGILDCGPTGSIIRKDVFYEFNGFKEVRNVSDFDFWLTVVLKYPVIEMEMNLIYWREHEGQEIKLAPEFYYQFGLQILQEHLECSSCPLTAKEIQTILAKQRRAIGRALIKQLLVKRKIWLFLKLWSSNDLSIFDLR